MFWEGIKQCSRFSLQSLNEPVEKLHWGQILTYDITYDIIYNIFLILIIVILQAWLSLY